MVLNCVHFSGFSRFPVFDLKSASGCFLWFMLTVTLRCFNSLRGLIVYLLAQFLFSSCPGTKIDFFLFSNYEGDSTARRTCASSVQGIFIKVIYQHPWRDTISQVFFLIYTHILLFIRSKTSCDDQLQKKPKWIISKYKKKKHFLYIW